MTANDLTTRLTLSDADAPWAEVSEIMEKLVKQVGNPNSGKTAVISSIEAHKLMKMLFMQKAILFDKSKQIVDLKSQLAVIGDSRQPPNAEG